MRTVAGGCIDSNSFACITSVIRRCTGGGVIVLMTMLNDLLQISFGPRVVPLDLVFGECLAFNQRAESFPSDLHWFSRIYFIGVLLLSWNSFLWHSRKGPHRKNFEPTRNYTRARIRTFALAAIVLPTSFLFSGYVGLGGSDAVVRSHLNKEVTTEHFHLYYSDDTLKTDQVDAVIRKAEWSFHYLTRLLTIVPQKTIRVYIYPDAETKYRLTSVRSAHASIRSIHIKESEVTGSVFLHELFHALQIEFRPSLKILLSRGMLEGSAMAIENGFFSVPESHALLAAANQMNYLPPISSIMSVQGFSRHRESVAYSVAGSFIGFLIWEHGWEPFKALNRSMDYLKVYGVTLDELEHRWLKFLKQVPFSNEERRISEGRFNPRSNPGYRSQTCPKTGAHHQSRIRKADDLYRAGQYRNALILYDQLNRENESFQGRWKSIQCLEKADALDDALDRIVQLWDSSALKPSEKSSLLKMKIRVLYRLRDWSAARVVIDARRQLNLETDTQKFLFENLIDQPSHQETFADYLDRRDRESSRMLLKRAMDLHPASPVFPFLMIREGLQKIRYQPLLRKYVFDFLENNPNQGDLVQTELLRVLRQAFDRAEYQDCDRICQLMLDHCRHPVSRFYANFNIKRLSFEKE